MIVESYGQVLPGNKFCSKNFGEIVCKKNNKTSGFCFAVILLVKLSSKEQTTNYLQCPPFAFMQTCKGSGHFVKATCTISMGINAAASAKKSLKSIHIFVSEFYRLSSAKKFVIEQI